MICFFLFVVFVVVVFCIIYLSYCLLLCCDGSPINTIVEWKGLSLPWIIVFCTFCVWMCAILSVRENYWNILLNFSILSCFSSFYPFLLFFYPKFPAVNVKTLILTLSLPQMLRQIVKHWWLSAAAELGDQTHRNDMIQTGFLPLLLQPHEYQYFSQGEYGFI